MKDAMHDVLACHGVHTTPLGRAHHPVLTSERPNRNDVICKSERAVRHSHASAGVTSTHHMHAFKVLRMWGE